MTVLEYLDVDVKIDFFIQNKHMLRNFEWYSAPQSENTSVLRLVFITGFFFRK